MHKFNAKREESDRIPSYMEIFSSYYDNYLKHIFSQNTVVCKHIKRFILNCKRLFP